MGQSHMFSALACFIVVPSGSTQGGAEINPLFLKNMPFKFQILFLFHFLHCSVQFHFGLFFWQWDHREEKVSYCRCGNVPEMLMFLQICLQVQILKKSFTGTQTRRSHPVWCLKKYLSLVCLLYTFYCFSL